MNFNNQRSQNSKTNDRKKNTHKEKRTHLCEKYSELMNGMK